MVAQASLQAPASFLTAVLTGWSRRNAMIAITSGRLASQGGSGVMNGVTALSIRKIASAASAVRCAKASRAMEESSPA
jgi:hypothetical protein